MLKTANPYTNLLTCLEDLESRELITGLYNSLTGQVCALGACLTNKELVCKKTKGGYQQYDVPVNAYDLIMGRINDGVHRNLQLESYVVYEENDHYKGTVQARYKHMVNWAKKREKQFNDSVKLLNSLIPAFNES